MSGQPPKHSNIIRKDYTLKTALHIENKPLLYSQESGFALNCNRGSLNALVVPTRKDRPLKGGGARTKRSIIKVKYTYTQS
jgi:hypothetical protein